VLMNSMGILFAFAVLVQCWFLYSVIDQPDFAHASFRFSAAGHVACYVELTAGRGPT
jgi:hypothetical protein